MKKGFRPVTRISQSRTSR